MHLLICHDLQRLDTRKLRRRVEKHGIYIHTAKSSSPRWNGKYFDAAWRDTFLTDTYQDKRELMDAVMYVPQHWNSSSNSSLGFAYRYTKPYFLSAVKHRRNWEDSAEHELLHLAHYLIWTYSGIKLEDVFDRDWETQ